MGSELSPGTNIYTSQENHTITKCKISTEVQTKYELHIPTHITINLKYGPARNSEPS